MVLQLSYFKSWKMMLWKWCTQYASKSGKLSSGPQDWKRSGFITMPKKGNDKEYSNYCTIALISYTSKLMLKILHAKFQQYVNCELPDVQVGFRKGRRTRDQISNILQIIRKARESKQTNKTKLLLLYFLCQTLWLCRWEQIVENSSRDGNTTPPQLPPVWRSRSNR